MSSSSKQPPSTSPVNAASREDLELLQRLLRVARLLKTRDVDDLCLSFEKDPTMYVH